MSYEIKAVLARSSATILQDLAGGISVAIVLIAGLYLPSLF